jgi:rare lipoprotein A
MKRAVLLSLLAIGVASCAKKPEVTASPHYVVGPAWQADGVWYYPQESFGYDETGLAAVAGDDHPQLTADGEVFDQDAMAAGHQTLQLPAIATVTNLENGRQITLRLNDRGPASPGRVIELTQRAAGLLGIPQNGTAQVRVQVDGAASRQLAEDMNAPGIKLAMTAAPRGVVQQADLPPPGGVGQGRGRSAPGVPTARPEDSTPAQAAIPQKLPATVRQGPASPGQLWIRADSFNQPGYAQRQSTQLASLGARVVPARPGSAGRYQVVAGPFATVAQADAALDQAIRAGVTDARIVVEGGGLVP